ncbi:hypothetical protein KFL_002320240 [Klebsormidium nitens]|uniref:MYND-type domain-containing protein n=1 Tax=Klebsormidium nitens TaxID=105231 RepID=A0A1Y1I383_KLENI|nr:hypothetical protein KFL_002320240 [Klebsormidium nitens]|eukprot:GAQ85390.1 hypothetical protein KFL_002320240 [Klebsormidium nitens]
MKRDTFICPSLACPPKRPERRIPAECFDAPSTRAVTDEDGTVSVQFVPESGRCSLGAFRPLSAPPQSSGLSSRCPVPPEDLCKVDSKGVQRLEPWQEHQNRIAQLKASMGKSKAVFPPPKYCSSQPGKHAVSGLPFESTVNRKRRQEEKRIAKENLKLAAAMEDIYKMGPRSSLRKKFDKTGIARPTGIAYVDCRPMWKQRTKLFLGDRDVDTSSQRPLPGRPKSKTTVEKSSSMPQKNGKIGPLQDLPTDDIRNTEETGDASGPQESGDFVKGSAFRAAGFSDIRVIISASDSRGASTDARKGVSGSQNKERPSSAPPARLAVVKTVLTQGAQEQTCTWGANLTVPATIPKTVGVRACAGCGFKSFSGADGRVLQTCARCRAVLYCSLACALVDRVSHRAVCAQVTQGRWQPFRPVEQNWVVSGSMARERAALKRALAKERKRAERKKSGGGNREVQ